MGRTFIKRAVSICIILILPGCICFRAQYFVSAEKPVTGSLREADIVDDVHQQKSLHAKVVDEEMDSAGDIIDQGEQYLYREAEGECELILYDHEGDSAGFYGNSRSYVRRYKHRDGRQ